MSLQEQRIGHMANEEIKMMNRTKGDENSKCVPLYSHSIWRRAVEIRN